VGSDMRREEAQIEDVDGVNAQAAPIVADRIASFIIVIVIDIEFCVST
jgi:hypothetical protein